VNHYLDEMNEKFFRPRNLYCIIMTWQPQDPAFISQVNLQGNIQDTIHSDSNYASSGGPHSTGQKFKHNLRESSGKASEFEFPEMAPLIFPALDGAVLDSEVNQGKLKRGKRFLDEYLDKRAHAKWAGANPDSKLANTVHTEFKSKYADPNHPASSGNIVSFVTGGRINPPGFGFGGLGALGGLGGRGYRPGYGMNPVEQRMAMAYKARGYGYGMNPVQQRMAMSGGLGGFGGRGFGGRAGMTGGGFYTEQQYYEQQQYSTTQGQGGRGMGRGLGGGMGREFGSMGNGMNPRPLGIGYILGGAKNMLQEVSHSH
jgi:hypothetical protein